MDASSIAYRAGATVGLIGGAVFVLANSPALNGFWTRACVALWVLLLAVALWGVWFRRPLRTRHAKPPMRRAGLVYALSCAGMVALIVIGRSAMAAAGQVTGVPAVVAAAVGLHFLPFARAFRATFFTPLGLALTGIGVAGTIGDIMVGPPVGSAAAVLAGLVMTGMIAMEAHRDANPRRRAGISSDAGPADESRSN